MPPTLEVKDSRYTLEVTATGPVILSDLGSDAHEQLDAWEQALPLAHLVWEKTGVESDLTLYDFTATAKDGRIWKITCGLNPAQEAVYTFAVADRFFESEFEPQRRLRETLARLTARLGITKIEIVWQ